MVEWAEEILFDDFEFGDCSVGVGYFGVGSLCERVGRLFMMVVVTALDVGVVLVNL